MTKAEDFVPSIVISGEFALSNATVPVWFADSCACWNQKDVRRARRLLKKGPVVRCKDATAFAALNAMALDMLTHGREVNAEILREYVSPPSSKVAEGRVLVDLP